MIFNARKFVNYILTPDESKLNIFIYEPAGCGEIPVK